MQQREMEDRAVIMAVLVSMDGKDRLDALTSNINERLRRGH